MTWIRNQKLTPEQIATIKYLRSTGVSLPSIAKAVADKYGLSISVVYYHCSENRDAYEYEARIKKKNERLKTKEKIYSKIAEGYNTMQIAREWNMEVAMVNKIYTT